MSNLVERQLSSTRLYKGRVISLRRDTVRLPDGGEAIREVVEHPGAVAVVACEGPDLLLVSQYRYAAGREMLELPAGKLDPGEEPSAAAARELEEETGYRPSALRLLGCFFTAPGFCDEKMWVFEADGLSPAEAHTDDDEFLSLRRLPLTEALAMVRSGQIVDAKTIAGLALAAAERGLRW